MPSPPTIGACLRQRASGLATRTIRGGQPPHGGFFTSATPMVRLDHWRAGWGDRKVCLFLGYRFANPALARHPVWRRGREFNRYPRSIAMAETTNGRAAAPASRTTAETPVTFYLAQARDALIAMMDESQALHDALVVAKREPDGAHAIASVCMSCAASSIRRLSR